MGKGGNVVCSLAIPPSYPKQGEVTLANIIGAPDFEEPSSLKVFYLNINYRTLEVAMAGWRGLCITDVFV